MIDFIFSRKSELLLVLIGGGLLASCIVASVLYVLDNEETTKYISEHECEIIKQKMRSEFNYVVQPNGKGLWLPVTKIDDLYECKIEGDRGSRFWIKG
jgi:hypothetical protein